jgi:Mu-like prophage I protein
MRIRATAPLVITTPPELVTIPNVEIVEVGENWETSTGTFTFDPEDLVAAVASQDDPGVRTPIIKLGHTDIRFNNSGFRETGSLDGQPALGKVENLRLTNNGMTLVGDYVGVPKWLAEIMPSAYPRRSFEGEMAYTSSTGNKWDMIVTAVALLGTAYPAINTLEDIQALYGSKAPVLYEVENSEATEVAAMVSDGTTIKAREADPIVKWRRKNGEQAAGEVAASADQRIAASSSVEDVRSAYYDSLDSHQMWWWVRQILVSPQQLVVDDDEGGLWTVDFTVDSNDTVTFGEPVSVKVEYVAAAKTSGLSRPGQLVAASFSSAEQAGGRPRGTLPTTEVKATEGVQPEEPPIQEEQPVKLTPEALERLGLAADATDADISAAIIAQGQQTGSGDDGNQQSQPETPATDPTGQPAEAPQGGEQAKPPVVPEGLVLVDASQWDRVQQSIAASDAERTSRREQENSEFIAAAVRDGKFPFARVEHYTALMSADPEGTRQLIGRLTPGLIPVTERATAPGPGQQIAAESSYPESWKPTVAATARRVGVRASGPRVTNAMDKVVS